MFHDPSGSTVSESLGVVKISCYEPKGAFDATKTGITLCAGAIAGLICGIAASYIGYYWFYLILLMPMLIGLAVGEAIAWGSKYSKNRNRWASAAAAVVASLITVGAIHVNDYCLDSTERAEFDAEDIEFAIAMKRVVQAGQELPPGLVAYLEEEEIDEAFLSWLQIESLFDYLNWEAEQGINISSSRNLSSKGINIGYQGTIIYWLLEGVIISFVATGIASRKSALPFCEECDEWYKEKQLAMMTCNASRIAGILETGCFGSLGRELPGSELTGLKLSRCPYCGSPDQCVVTVNKITYYNNHKNEKNMGSFVIPDEGVRQLSSILNSAKDEVATLQAIEELRGEIRQSLIAGSDAGLCADDEVEQHMARLMQEQSLRVPAEKQSQ